MLLAYFPEARERFGRARRDHALVIDCVIERVWKEWRLVVEHGHRAVVREVGFIQHFKHLISYNRTKQTDN